MQGIKGVEAVLGCCDCYIPTCSVIAEYNDRGKDRSDNSIVHHQREGED